jgi:hypothetical protein
MYICIFRFFIEHGESTPRVMEIVNLIKQLNPDAVLWCDRAACRSYESSEEFLPLQSFKDANYLPKALSMLDCLDSHVVPDKSKYLEDENFLLHSISIFYTMI